MRRIAFLLLAGCAIVAFPAASSGKNEPEWALAVLPNGTEFALEVAADPLARARGYMFRDEVGPREGMLFRFDESDRHSFWMKNCKVSLDIVWLDEADRVVHIARDLHPCPAVGDCPSTIPLLPARSVLEFASGTAQSQGLKVGDQIIVLTSGGGR